MMCRLNTKNNYHQQTYITLWKFPKSHLSLKSKFQVVSWSSRCSRWARSDLVRYLKQHLSISKWIIDWHRFPDLPTLLSTQFISKNMKFPEIRFLTRSDFLVISKSRDKCNMSLLVVVVLVIESTHHYVRWQADSPPLLQFPACSIAWKPSFWSKNDY